MKELKCDDVEAGLQDFVDGDLGAAEERAMREHLAACGRCRSEERQMRRLLAQVAELPRSVEPPRDLWPELTARLGERPEASAGEVTAPVRRRGPWRWSSRQWALQAAAAILFMAIGGLLSQWLVNPSNVVPPSPFSEAQLAAEPATASPGFQTMETEYLRAKTAWWLMVYSRHEELSPETIETLQRNLVVLDKAIWELRQALEADPGNQRLEGLLLAQHRRGIDLLRRLAERST